MTKTTNYQLPKWEKTDRIQMKDFNDAMDNLEAALSERRFTWGIYAGDGTDGRELELGFEGIFALIFSQTGEFIEHCFVTPGGALYRSDHSGSMSTHTGVGFTGTKLHLWANDPYCNRSGKNYFYIAFRK